MTYGGGTEEGRKCLVSGTYYCGVVFSYDPKGGAEALLHSFTGFRGDGANPWASLIDMNGRLYGTTVTGGSHNKNCGYGLTEPVQGCGTVFALDPATGVDTILHSFQENGADGYAPFASLVDVHGMLYGTTSIGGDNTGCGFRRLRQWLRHRVLSRSKNRDRDGALFVLPPLQERCVRGQQDVALLQPDRRERQAVRDHVVRRRERLRY